MTPPDGRQLPDGQALQQAALTCLMADSLDAKLSLTASVARQVLDGMLPLDGVDSLPARRIDRPGRPQAPKLVPARQVAQRGLGTPAGRAAFIHAIAHIEFNAIDLAWDAVYRFQGMPPSFYLDWASIAADEARHFSLLNDRLKSLGHAYGDFDAHNGLWEMALATEHSCLARMALVPRVLEARGLDVTPAMIERLKRVDDQPTAEILEIILREEVAHVAAGSRWFHWCCERDGKEPDSTFQLLVKTHALGAVRGPFNRPDRFRAGFSEREIVGLESIGPPPRTQG